MLQTSNSWAWNLLVLILCCQGRVHDKTNVEGFRSQYFAGPKTCEDIFNDLRTTPENPIAKPNPVYLLMALHWLKAYRVEHAMAGMFKCVEKTARERSWEYVQRIAELKTNKVSAQTGITMY